MTTRRPPATCLAIALIVAALVAACGSADPSPPPSASVPASTASASPGPTPSASPTPASSDRNEALYAEIEAQVEEMRGLRPKEAVVRKVLDEAGLRVFAKELFERDTPAPLVRSTESLFKALLLLPGDASLQDLFIELVASQAGGVYDHKTRLMIVVSKTGQIGPLEKAIYAHEYVHALQDQTFGTRSVIGEAKDQGDRSLARLTTVEGDAYLTMFLWMQAHLTPAEQAQVTTATDPAAMEALEKLPEIVKQQLMFPATAGITIALGDWQQGGFAAIDERFASPPDSTEQILHADKLAAGEKPLQVTFPSDLASRLGSGWTVPLQDTMGEMQLEILLRVAGGARAADSADASAGWGGDRVALLEGPSGANAVVLETAWDTRSDAGEFSAALGGLVTRLEAAGRSAAVLIPSRDRVVLISAGDAATLGRVANVLGLAG